MRLEGERPRANVREKVREKRKRERGETARTAAKYDLNDDLYDTLIKQLPQVDGPASLTLSLDRWVLRVQGLVLCFVLFWSINMAPAFHAQD